MEDIGNLEQEIDYVAIKVTSGILIHIGAGIYNSVAGAIKELISNSFDADATSVTISTDYPYFNEIKVVDNGRGMSKKRLRQTMQTIGSSLKNLDKTKITKEYKRPIIGHLGIGLMALSQICSKARIESQEPDTDIKLIAELDFSQFKDREEEQMLQASLEVMHEKYGGLDVMRDIINNHETDEDFRVEVEVDLEIASQAKERLEELKEKRPETDLEGEHLGYCLIYPDIPSPTTERGTTITLTEIDKEVKDQLRDENREDLTLPKKYKDVDKPWDEYRSDINSWSWKELCERLRLGTSNLKFSDIPYYHQFLWELAAMTPIEYFPNGPMLLDKKILHKKKQELKDFNFTLTVDNHKLVKPVLLPSGNVGKEPDNAVKGLDYEVRTIGHDGIVDGSTLKYTGYIYWQREQNKPNMIQGLQIYIRNVGIGLFDRTILNYDRVNPGSRIPQTCGEIYIEDGLENALSVDRSSFRETDAHYMFLRNQIWGLLGTYKGGGKGLFGASVEAYYKRKEIQDAENFQIHLDELEDSIRNNVEKNISVKILKEDSNEPYLLKENEMFINEESSFWPRALKDRWLYQKVMVPVKVAVENGATAREILHLLEKLLLGIEGDGNAK